MNIAALLGKFASAPYSGMAMPAQVGIQGANAVQPQAPPQQAAPSMQAPMAAPQPSIAQQAAPGAPRQQRGYNNTPLKQNSGTPGTPGRPPAGSKKTANAYCPPGMPVTGPMSGMGPGGIGMKPPMMSPMMGQKSPIPQMPKSATAKRANGPCCDMPKRPKKPVKPAVPVRQNKKANIDDASDYASRAPGSAMTGGALGTLLGTPAGALVGLGRGNAAEGAGRGMVRGGLTGAGVGAGGALGLGLGRLVEGGERPGLGAILGGLAGNVGGGYGGWRLSDSVLGKPVGAGGKKEKDKTDQEKSEEKK